MSEEENKREATAADGVKEPESTVGEDGVNAAGAVKGESGGDVSAAAGAGTNAKPEGTVDGEREAKLKAAAEARAARAAAKAKTEAEAAGAGAGEAEGATGTASGDAADPEREAKLKAAAEARAARAAAKAKAEAEAAGAGAGETAEQPKPPSIRLPELELLQKVVRSEVAKEALDEAYLNELNDDMPTLVVNGEHWPATAKLLKEHGELRFDYLRNVTGVDYETHLEVVYHLLSLTSKRVVAVKIRTERDAASVPSATPIWRSAEWNEREIYDLLGVDFPGHPDMRRIMMPDDWVGHPLRKDYEPLDSEV